MFNFLHAWLWNLLLHFASSAGCALDQLGAGQEYYWFMSQSRKEDSSKNIQYMILTKKKYRFLWSNGRFKALPFYDKFRQDFSPRVIDSLASTTKISWNMNFIQHRCQWNKNLTFKFKAFCSQNRSQLFDIPKILNSNYVY